jgi:hypothetical protein
LLMEWWAICSLAKEASSTSTHGKTLMRHQFRQSAVSWTSVTLTVPSGRILLRIVSKSSKRFSWYLWMYYGLPGVPTETMVIVSWP